MSYQVIARKWRPQNFADLVGQSHVTDTLKNAIEKNRVAHAYIFSGARGVGKTTAARILAKALNCVKGPTAEPCGECDSCREIAAGTSLDVIEIDAASNRGIEQIRELREMVRYAPAAARSKVVILDEAHMLTGEASNALLKTLEEPPDRVIFVMATTEPESLADTIRSRSQHFHFRALTFSEIAARIEEIAARENLRIEPGAVSVIARMAEGSVRDALSLLEQARAYCGDTMTDAAVRELLGVVPEDALEELVNAIAAGSAERALVLVHTFQREGRNLQHFCREAIRHMRNLLVARVCGPDSGLIAATPDQRPALARAAQLFSEEDLTRYFQILLQTDDDLRRKPDPRLHLEMGLLRMVNASRLAPLEEILEDLQGGGNPGGPPRQQRMMAAPVGSADASLPGSRSSTIAGTSINTATRAPSAAAAGAAVGSAAAAAAPAFTAASAVSVRESQQDSSVSEPSRASSVARESDAAETQGISAEQVAEIKSTIQSQQKFLGELTEHGQRWELEGTELRIYFPVEKRALAELLEGREAIEKLRVICGKVLGRPVRVCAKISSSGAGVTAASRDADVQLRTQFENDPVVKSILQRFGGKISEVKRTG
jgi:DNA polymerase-3 subunit gamma/tau